MPTTRPITTDGTGDGAGDRPDVGLQLSDGPVAVNVEYGIDASDVAAFLAAAARFRRTRRRNGARRWALLQDVADPKVWTERFEVPTWLDYLRLTEHMTRVDADVARRALSFHKGETAPIMRFLLAHVPEGGGTRPPLADEYQRNQYDPSLPPAMSAATPAKAPPIGQRP